MSETILELMEERVRVLTLALARTTAHVNYKEGVFESALLHRKQIERSLLIGARMDLAAITGRQREAESAWELIKAHKGECIS